MTNVTPAETADQPDHFAEIAAELHRAADDIAKLVGSDLPKPTHVALDIHAGGPHLSRDDNRTARAVDALGGVLLGKPGTAQKMYDDTYHYGTKSTKRGPIVVHVYDSVSTAWAVKRETAAQLAAKEAELERLRAEVNALRAAAALQPDAFPSGMDYTRADTDADDPTPISPARMPLHTGAVVDGGRLIDETETPASGLTPAADQSRGALAGTTPVVTYFSFGHGQTDPGTGKRLLDHYVTVVAPTYEACREAMLASRFGRVWSFDYLAGTARATEWIPRWTEHEVIVAPGTDPALAESALKAARDLLVGETASEARR